MKYSEYAKALTTVQAELEKLKNYKLIDKNFYSQIISQIDITEETEITSKLIKLVGVKPDLLEIISISKTAVLARIKSYTMSHALGSKNWCIANGTEYWRKYVTSEGNNQYFFWIYKPGEKTANERLIGFTCRNVPIISDNSPVTYIEQFDCSFNDANDKVSKKRLASLLKKHSIDVPFTN